MLKNSSGPSRAGIRRMIILFVVPMLVFYIAFFLYPTINAFYTSLFDWNGFTAGKDFIGLANYKELMRDRTFWSAVKNSMLQMVVGGIFCFALALLFSGILATKFKGRRIHRAILFFPAIINPVAIAIMWSFILNSNWGLMNTVLSALHLESLIIPWTEPGNLFWVIVFTNIWMECGYYCVILLAGLDRVPPDCIEAAQLDGASELKIFFSIKMPLIKDILGTSLTMWAINCVKEFALFYAWCGAGGNPTPDQTNMAVKMYITAFGGRNPVFRMGYGTAIGVCMFAVVAIAIILINSILKTKALEY